MLHKILGDQTSYVDVNRPRSLFAIIYLAVIGPCVFILQPGFVQGLVDLLGFSEQQAGQVAASEMFGLATTTIVLVFIASRVSWRVLTTIFIALSTIGNIASAMQTDYQSMLVLRFITGLGSGGLISLTFTMMGLTKATDRNFGFIVVGVLTYGAFGLLAMPSAFALVNMGGVLIFFGLFCASGLFLVRFLPNESHQDTEHPLDQGPRYSLGLKVFSLAGILLYNVAIGIVWTYMFLVGLEAGAGVQPVANALTLSQFLGIAGAFLAVIFERKLGRLLPLMIGILGGAAGIYLLLDLQDLHMFTIGVCVFNLLWNLSMPYLLATLADFDKTGKIVVYGVCMQMIGYAVGPYIATTLLAEGENIYDAVNLAGIILFAISAFMMIPAILSQQKRMKQETLN